MIQQICFARRTKYSDVRPEGSLTPPPKIVLEVETTWPWVGRWVLVVAPPFRTVVPRNQPFALGRDMIASGDVVPGRQIPMRLLGSRLSTTLGRVQIVCHPQWTHPRSTPCSVLTATFNVQGFITPLMFK